MKAFLTGSRAYGLPKENSDYDIVVLMDDDLLLLLNEASEDKDPGFGNGYTKLKFGNLNLIALTDEMEFKAWRDGTEELIKRMPVTCGDAKALLIDKVNKALGGV